MLGHLNPHMSLKLNKTRKERRKILKNHEFFPMVIQKGVQMHVVWTTLIKQNRPLTLCIVFEEFFDIGVLLSSQLFKQLAIVNDPPLSTTIDSIADPLFEPIRELMDATSETMTP